MILRCGEQQQENEFAFAEVAMELREAYMSATELVAGEGDECLCETSS